MVVDCLHIEHLEFEPLESINHISIQIRFRFHFVIDDSGVEVPTPVA
jgi:hypothetical protein